MAEGGGTVGYLSRPNPNGVSVHFVVEYTGRVVQMLDLTHLHSSIRVTAIRGTDDPPYDWLGESITYGATAANAVLGSWWKNPNNASVGVEVEGFAASGPNVAQRAGIAGLWLDMAERYPGIRSLGHRDFADYKACPGKHFPWDAVGGHGPEDDMPGLKVMLIGDKAISGVFRTTIDTEAIYLHDRSIRDAIEAGRPFQALGTYARDFDAAPGYVLTESRIPSWVSETAGTFTPDAPLDCTDSIALALADEQYRVRGVRDQAIEKLEEI